jgi:hypothetical protein
MEAFCPHTPSRGTDLRFISSLHPYGGASAPHTPSHGTDLRFISSLHTSHGKSVYFASAPWEGGVGALAPPQNNTTASAHTS